MKRIFCLVLVATLSFGSVLAAAPTSKSAKVTLVYQHRRAGRGAARRRLGGRLRCRVRLSQLSEIVQRVRDGRLRTNIGNVSTLDDAVAALNPTERRRGKTIIRVRP